MKISIAEVVGLVKEHFKLDGDTAVYDMKGRKRYLWGYLPLLTDSPNHEGVRINEALYKGDIFTSASDPEKYGYIKKEE